MEEDDHNTFIALQRSELMVAKTFYSDSDFAFNLQLQEAITASSQLLSPPPSPPPPPPPPPSPPPSSEIAEIMLNEIERYEQERRDSAQCKLEIQKLNHHLSIQLHDQKFASEIARIPEDDWLKYGDNFEKPYYDHSGASSSSLASGDECFRMYFKGIVVDDKLAAIGVAICDRKDNSIFELSKSVADEEEKRGMSGERVELEALVAGLETAWSLDLKRIEYLCDSYLFYDSVSSRRRPVERSVAKLIDRVNFLHEKFVHCIPRLVAQSEVKFAFELARASITSQLIRSADHCSEDVKETCSICYEDRLSKIMFSVDGCGHRYCSVCMVKHLESKLLQGGLPKCPFGGCNSGIRTDSCRKLLPPKLLDIMSQRLIEATIPAAEKVFCPIPTCSTLMSIGEVKEYSKTAVVRQEELGACRCIKCHVLFCADCKVPWHFAMTCNSYQYFQTNSDNADTKLKCLAKKRKWWECQQCKNMIELAEGCYHITCRCGYEFCYICGAEWKNKKATCQCRLWDERNIIRNRNGRRN